MTRAARRAFTLVELLVVIGIIAVLISILLPTLNKVRQSAIRTQCMSNQRQLLLGLEMYRSASKGKCPNYIPGGNMAGSLQIRREYGDWSQWEQPANGRFGVSEQGWMHLGRLYLKRYIRDGRVYYCPINVYFNYENQWPANSVFPDTNNGRVYSGYSYRIGGFGSVSSLGAQYAADIQDEMNFDKQACAGRFRGIRSITSDFFGYNPFVPANWPHVQPYSMCVGWTDGHVTTVTMQRKDWYIIAGYTALNDADKHQTMLFRWAFDEDNLQKVRTALNIK